jgi:hypothetical protein
MNLVKGQKQLLGFEYDFAVDGGAVSTIALRQFAGQSLEAGVHIVNAYICIDTVITSTGTPTVTIGNDDADGYFADFFATQSASKKCICAGELAGALLWDDTNDHIIAYTVGATATQAVGLAIGTAALTAGKFRLYLEVLA